MTEPEAEVTEEQANAALLEMVGATPETPETPEVPKAPAAPATEAAPPEGTEPPIAEPEAVETAPEGEQTAEGGTAPAEEVTEVVETDDVASLKARIKESEDKYEAAEKRTEARMEAMQQRAQQGQEILRKRMLQKSTLSDKMAQVLRKSRSTEGVPESEVDQAIREFEGSLNPASPSYVPMQTQQLQQQPSAPDNEEQVLVLNEFFNEKGMDLKESNKFGEWVKNKATSVMPESEQRVAEASLGGFLRLAHMRYEQVVQRDEAAAETKRSDTMKATKSVQRTQRAAASAASPSIAAPKKQPAPKEAEIDYDKFESGDISDLLKAAVKEFS